MQKFTAVFALCSVSKWLKQQQMLSIGLMGICGLTFILIKRRPSPLKKTDPPQCTSARNTEIAFKNWVLKVKYTSFFSNAPLYFNSLLMKHFKIVFISLHGATKDELFF